jgi:hypothetical protein
MPIVLGSNTITGIGNGGLPSGCITADTLSSSTRVMKLAQTSWTGSAGGSGDTGWVSWQSVSFTVTEQGSSIHCWFNDVQGYEAGAGNGWTRFVLTGSTSATSHETNSLLQGHAANWSYGSQKTHYVFTGVNTGAHTLYLQYRQYNATAYWSYFNNFGNRAASSFLQAGYY